MTEDLKRYYSPLRPEKPVSVPVEPEFEEVTVDAATGEIIEPEPAPAPEPDLRSDELAELFEVPEPEDNDMFIDDLFEVDSEDEDDLSDLTSVSNEDVMGPAPKPVQRRVVRRVRRTSRPYTPPSSMRGIR